MNMNHIGTNISGAKVKFSLLEQGRCFDVSPPGEYGFYLMKTDQWGYVSLINGRVEQWPKGYDPDVYPAPKGAVVSINVMTREK